MKITKVSAILVLTLYLTVLPVGPVKAAPMGTAFTYQGRLIDNSNAADGLYDFEFSLYDSNDPCTGTQQGSTIDINDLDVIDGYFTVELDFGSTVFNGDARWLEISVRVGDSNDAHTALSPRQELTPTPYSLQTRGIFVDDSGNVGIGTTNPGAKLEVLQSDWEDVVKIGADFATNRLILSSGSIWASISGSTTNRDDIAINHSSGNVGIGTTNPTSDLHVEGTIEVDDTIKADDQGGLRFATDEGTTRLFIEDTGDIGIGTTTPGGKLDVQNSSNLVSANIRNSKSSDVAYGINVLANGEGGTSHYAGRFSASGAAENFAIYADGINSKSYFQGNVGIGRMSPAYKLDVAGAANLNSGISGTPALYVNSSEAIWYNGTYFSWGYGGSANYFADKVGIGVTNPGYLLTVGTGSASWEVYINDDLYVVDTISALTVVDRTSYPPNLATAYEAVMSMERLPDGQYEEDNKEAQLDHSKLSDFIRSEDGNRDLSATVSCQNEVLKDLIRKQEEMDNAHIRIEQLNDRNKVLEERVANLEIQLAQLTVMLKEAIQ